MEVLRSEECSIYPCSGIDPGECAFYQTARKNRRQTDKIYTSLLKSTTYSASGQNHEQLPESRRRDNSRKAFSML